ncbi:MULTISPECIES: CBS domain-containing protein [Halorubrum]|uniref:Zinc metalloprotease n=1 Tax=Halorubrum sodomense TaxID=35743 RepID=A0A1I6FKK7_HALSD|nr:MULTISPECIES: CBS domain-containing protein [Halorubrum]TKX54157.1 CBS domain-containing protein [Halorubrum sp. SP3]SFR30428.1 Zn-dependent protease (includes SpoIVFB) [Halorubrum sodomense]
MRGIKVGSAFGIPIRLNWTFLLVLPLFAYLIGGQVGTIAEVMNETAGLGIDAGAVAAGNTPWILGLSAAVGLFVGVLLHEFGHSLVAMRYGYEIESITLWLLGGLASFAEFPEDWRHEFWIAIAGPLVSVAVGVACYGVVLVGAGGSDAVRFVFGYLALLNVVLAVFNMLPAFPMDGGRVLRALLARNQPHAQATQRAASVGKVFAFLMGIVGLFTFQLLLIVLAFFVYVAASGEAQQTTLKAAFEGVTVTDVMTPREDLHTVTEDTSVADLMSRMFEERHTGYPVLDGDDLVGMVTLEDARSVKEVERDAYRVDDVMATDVVGVDPDADALSALQAMQQNGVGRLPVIDADGELVGLISRTDLMTAFNIIQTGGTPGVISGRRRADEDPGIL